MNLYSCVAPAPPSFAAICFEMNFCDASALPRLMPNARSGSEDKKASARVAAIDRPALVASIDRKIESDFRQYKQKQRSFFR